MTYLDRTDSFMYAAVGNAAYRVGGSVRDEILGRRVKDADYVVVGLTLDELRSKIQELLDKTRLEKAAISPLKMRDGQQGGWRVSGRGLGVIEIMLPRTEISTGPRHQDFKIIVDPDLPLETDARRRDFTFNALYRQMSFGTNEGTSLLTGPDGTVHENLVDPTGMGLEDLHRRRINITHADSFRDDPLRILRALRFVSTLGYELGAETHALMAVHAQAAHGLSLKGYASGTVFDEFSKLLMGENPAEALRIARHTGVLSVVMPELAPMLGFDQGSRYHDLTTDEHTFKAIATAAHVDAPLEVRWALLFHDSGKPASAWVGNDGRKHYYENPALGKEDHQDLGADIWLEAAYRLNVPKTLRADVETLIANHMVTYGAKHSRVARERIRLGDEMYRWLLLHRMCDLTGKGKPNFGHMRTVKDLEEMRAKMEMQRVPRSHADLAIRGRDIVEMGVQGKKVGEILDRVLDEVALDPGEPKNTREWQLAYAERAAHDG